MLRLFSCRPILRLTVFAVTCLMPGRYVETHQMTSSKIAKHLLFVSGGWNLNCRRILAPWSFSADWLTDWLTDRTDWLYWQTDSIDWQYWLMSDWPYRLTVMTCCPDRQYWLAVLTVGSDLCTDCTDLTDWLYWLYWITVLNDSSDWLYWLTVLTI